jgi:hypothetical protein
VNSCPRLSAVVPHSLKSHLSCDYVENRQEPHAVGQDLPGRWSTFYDSREATEAVSCFVKA